MIKVELKIDLGEIALILFERSITLPQLKTSVDLYYTKMRLIQVNS